MDSIEGRLNTFKETVKSLWTNSIDSGSVKSILSGATSIVSVFDSIIKKVGVLPTVFTTAIGALTIFNTKFRSSTTMFSNMIPFVNTLNVKFQTWSTRLNTTSQALQRMIVSQKEQITAAQAQGNSTTAMGAKLASLNIKLAETKAQMLLVKAASVGLQTALNVFGGMAISGIVMFVDNLIHAKENLKSFNDEFVNTMQTDNKPKQGEELIKQYELLKQQLEGLDKSTDAYKTKENELKEVQNQLISLYPDASTAIDQNTGAKQLNLDATKQLIEEDKKLALAQAEKVMGKNDINGTKDIEGLINKYKEASSYLDELRNHQQAGDKVFVNSAGVQVEVADAIKRTSDSYEEYKNKLEAVKAAIPYLESSTNEWAGSQELLKNVLSETGEKSNESAEKIKLLGTAINELQTRNDLTNGTLGELNQMFPELGINSENAGSKLDELKSKLQSLDDGNNSEAVAEALVGIGEAAEESKTKLEDLQNAFNGFSSTKELIQEVIGEMEQYGGITEKTYGKVIGNADVIATLKQNGDQIQNLNNLYEKMTEAQQETIDKAFEQTDVITNCEQEQANAKIDCDSQKQASDAETNDQIQTNTANTTIANSNEYVTDTGNFETEGNNKTALNDAVMNAIANGTSLTMNSLGQLYSEDVVNFVNAVNAKIEAMNGFAKMFAQATAAAAFDLGQKAPGGFAAEAASQLGLNGGGINIPVIDKVGSNYAPQMVSTPSVGSGGGGRSGGSGSKGGKSDEEKAAEKAAKLAEEIAEMSSDVDLDRYFNLNNIIQNIDNELDENSTIMDSVIENSKEYQDCQIKEIEINKRKQTALQNLNEEQIKESKELREYLEQYQFTFDEMGNLTNSQEMIKYWQDVTNAMGGNTEEAKEEKQEWIDWIKELSEKSKRYAELVNKEIPEVTNKWKDLGKEIKKARMEMLEATREQLAGYILEDLKKEYETLKEKLEADEKNDIEKLENEKKAMIDSYEAQIKALQDELDALEDDEADKRKKLKALKKDLADWRRDDSSFSARKQQELQSQIAELEKEIKKDEINKEIDDLKERQSAKEEDFDKRINEREKYYDEQKKLQEELHDDLLMEQKAYGKADELLRNKQMGQIEKIMSSHAENFREIGSLLGENFAEALTSQIQNAIDSVDMITNLTNNNTLDVNKGSKPVGQTLSDGSWWGADVGDHVWIADASSSILYSDQYGSSKGTGWENGVASADELVVTEYDNGRVRLADSKGNDIGWIDRYDLNKWNDAKHFATGGLVKYNNTTKEKLAYVGDGEQILQPTATEDMHSTFDFVKKSSELLNNINKLLPTSSASQITGTNGIDLGKLTKNIVTNNNSNPEININFGDIINHNGAEAIMNRKEIAKVVRDVVKDDLRRFR